MSAPLLIQRPTLVVDEARVRRNIARMVERAQRARVTLRPHFKTHQSPAIGDWFREAGVDRIAVSSVDMAVAFAAHGWNDITVAFPCNIQQLDTLEDLARRVRLGIVVDHRDTVAFLRRKCTTTMQVWIKIDVGYGRAGVHWADADTVEALVQALSTSSQLEFAGLMTHAGHSYAARSLAQVQEIAQASMKRLRSVQAIVRQQTGSLCRLSSGDTPTLSLGDDIAGVDEIRPGNFVFYDVMQLALGSCSADDIALAVACPVVGKYAPRNEMLLYGGAVHFSKDHLRTPATTALGGLATEQKHVFGLVVESPRNDSGWGRVRTDAVLCRVSQEHGILKVGADFLAQSRIGDTVYVLPVHSCLAADLFPAYISLQGKRLERFRSNDTLPSGHGSMV